MPKVSVLIPVCNVERYLRECLDSVQKQTLKDIEIICIDDGSTDSSPKIIDRYSSSDTRFRVIHKPNTGYGDSMNLGLKQARGKYIAILESDDKFEPDALERLVCLAESANADVAKADFWLYWSASNGTCEDFQGETADKQKAKLQVKGQEVYKVREVQEDQELQESQESRKERKIPFGIIDASWTGKVIDPLCDQEIFYRKPSIWSAIYRRDFLQNNSIDFLATPGASYQDAGFNFKVWASARRVVFDTAKVLYYRQDNEKSSVNSPKKVFCVCDEYNEMRRWLYERPELASKLAYVLTRMKFNTYMWNFERLSPELRSEFIMRISAEFSLDIEEDLVDFNMFDPAGKADFLCIAKDPKKFLELREKFAGSDKLDIVKRYGAMGGIPLVAKIAKRKILGTHADSNKHKTVEEAKIDESEYESTSSSFAPYATKKKFTFMPKTTKSPAIEDSTDYNLQEPSQIDWGNGPMISVIVPVYNVEKYLSECLDSLLAQTLERIQIVCVDDGSTDSSPQILKNYAERDRRIKVITQTNKGLSAARNAGIAAADAPVVAFLDSDDSYEPDACKKIVCAFGDTNADMVTFGAKCVPNSGGDKWLEEHLSPRDAVFYGYSSHLIFEEASHPYPRTSCTIDFLRRENLSFDETLRYAEDELFYLSAYPVAKKVALISDKIYRYRVFREGSLTSNIDFGSPEVIEKHIEVVRRVFVRWQELFGEDSKSESLLRISQIVHWSIDYALYGIFCLDEQHRNELLAKFIQMFVESLGSNTTKLLLSARRDKTRDSYLLPCDAELLSAALDVAIGIKQISDLQAKTLRLKYIASEHGIGYIANKLAGKA